MTMLTKSSFWTNLTGMSLLAVACATPIMMSSVMDRGYEIAKLALAEPLSLFALASILIAHGWRWNGQASTEARIATLCLLLFLAFAGYSTAVSEQPGVALFGTYFRREGLLAWACYAAFFIAMLEWTRRQASSTLLGFLDVVLLASIVPAVYAIQQRLGLDFFFVANRDLTRPNGTLGNPVFLGAYLALLLPITTVRCWQARRHVPELTLWLSLTLLQLSGLLLTQSRGPLLAGILGLALLAGMAAAYKQSRGSFAAIGGFLMVVAVVVTAINTNPAIQRVASGVPLLNRMIYNLEDSAPFTATSLASRSTASRLGIWQAATETFMEAPARVKLLGFGPESAYANYYPHLPDAVLRVSGYSQSNTFDRFHADTLDIGLNYGILGWLLYCGFFSTILLAAVRALFAIAGNTLCWTFAALPLAGGAIAWILVTVAKLPMAIAPAFGLGMGGVWMMLLIGCAWRAARNGLPEHVRAKPELWSLLAGLAVSLLVFWMDAQINIPTLTTRLASFGMAALILAIAATMAGPAPKETDSASTVPQWGIAFAAVAACASFLPAMVLDASMRAQETDRWWLSGIPIGILLTFGALHARIRFTADGYRQSTFGRWVLGTAGITGLYALVHWALVPKVGVVIDPGNTLQLAFVAYLGVVYVLLLSIVFAWIHRIQPARASLQEPLRPPSFLSAISICAVAVLTAYAAWTAGKADIGSRVAGLAASRQPVVSDQILLASIKALPHEREYQRQRTFSHLGRAIEDIKTIGTAPEIFSKVELALDQAEQQARDSLEQFPGDPWIVLALANVMQIRALAIIRPFAPTEGRLAASEANELFNRAYEIFPNQPLVLRNWAQLRFNEGDHWGAYRLIDRMEEVIPNELEPYSERIIIAKQINDLTTIRETMERAASRLDPQTAARLAIVAEMQH